MKGLLRLLHTHPTKSKNHFKYFSSVIITTSFRDKAILYLHEKGIIDPKRMLERVILDSKAIERFTCLISGDIITHKTTFTAEFAKFCDNNRSRVVLCVFPVETFSSKFAQTRTFLIVGIPSEC